MSAPSSLTEVGERLEGIEHKLDLVLAALTTAANEAAASNSARQDVTRRLAALERWRADLEDRMIHLEDQKSA